MLEIEIQKIPQAAERVKTETVTLIEAVLSALQYDGKWLLRFVQKVKNRSDRKFQVVRRQGTGILIKTKPKDNGSCWELILSPPPGQVPQAVFENLRTVHPTRLFDPPPHSNAPMNPLAVPERLGPLPPGVPPDMYVPGRFAHLLEDGKLKTPTSKKNPPEEKISKREAKKRRRQRKQEERTKAIKEQQEKNKKELDQALYLSPEKVETTLTKSQHALLCGLIALTIEADSKRRIRRPQAMSVLVEKLNLIDFVSNSSYRDPIKVAAAITRGLCESGWADRWLANKKKESSQDYTNGFIITDRGLDLLRQVESRFGINTPIGKLLKEALDLSNKPIVLENNDEDTPEIQDPTDLFSDASEATEDDVVEDEVIEEDIPSVALDVVMDRLGDLQPLIERHDRISQEIDKYNEEIQGCQGQIEKNNASIASLEEQIGKLEKEVGELRQKNVQLGKDLQGWEKAAQEEEGELARIKGDLKRIVGE